MTVQPWDPPIFTATPYVKPNGHMAGETYTQIHVEQHHPDGGWRATASSGIWHGAPPEDQARQINQFLAWIAEIWRATPAYRCTPCAVGRHSRCRRPQGVRCACEDPAHQVIHVYIDDGPDARDTFSRANQLSIELPDGSIIGDGQGPIASAHAYRADR